MRILYVFRSLAIWGGIERILVDKMNYLVSVYGYDVYMLTSDQGNHPVPYHLDERVHLEDLDIRFHQKYRYNLFKRSIVSKRLKCLYEQRLKERLSQIKPDVIVCTTADHIDSLVKLKGKVPLVVESHSICLRTIEQGSFFLLRKIYRYNYLKALSKVNTLIALTEGDALEWRKVHHHVVVIPNMVHLNDGPLSTVDNKRVIFVGRFDYQKRPLELIKIWQKVYAKFPDWRLDIYGEGEQFSEIETAIHSQKINVFIHKPTGQILDRYRESSILVSTSLFEPFGLVIPEAMSCGLPVVTYNCPYGPANIIGDGINGFLIRVGERDDFITKICLLISDKTLRIKLGKAAVNASRQYHATKIMPLWDKLFRENSTQQFEK